MKSQELSVIIHGGGGNFSEEHGRAKIPHLRTALDAAWNALTAGEEGEAAVAAALRVLESVELFDAGYGAYPNVDGIVELDVGLMRGDRKFACLMGARNLMFPSGYVLDQLRHGKYYMQAWTQELAAQLALASEETKAAYGYVASNSELVSPFVKELVAKNQGFEVGSRGTVGCVIRDEDGRICAGTSTGGVFNKPTGRVGDTPIIGAGVFADDEICGLSATGKGEAILAGNLSGGVIAEMRRELRTNSNAFYEDNDLLRRILEAEFTAFSAHEDGDAALIVMPPKGLPSYAFNTTRVSIATRTGSKNKVRVDEVLIDSLEGDEIR